MRARVIAAMLDWLTAVALWALLYVFIVLVMQE
jgi:hypothetical protein